MNNKLKKHNNNFSKIKLEKNQKLSSYNWLNRHLNDPYVIKAKAEKYRSRAAYKLIEINNKFKILKPGMTIIDLGAAPGGWSQVASKAVRANNTNSFQILAIDLLPIKKITGVKSLCLDFLNPNSLSTIQENIPHNLVDGVISDMAANTTGHFTTDYIRITDLCYHSFIFANNILKPGGNFITKILRGGTEHIILKEITKNFKHLKHFKPKSSRKESSEMYLIALQKL